MDAYNRLQNLTKMMDFEPAEDTGCSKISARQQDAVFVNEAVLPNGKRITLLKTLLTSVCERNCYYCPFRSGRDFRRASLRPDEMAQVFMSMHRAGVVQGIFLSSGMAGGGVTTQDKLLATAEILRNRYKFPGYLHLKLMPGAERAQVERAMQLADRVSLNLEAPNTKRLRLLAPKKIFMDELFQTLRWVDEIRRTQPAYWGWKRHWPSMTTQFVVGAVGESDEELLTTTATMHRELNLGRAYFSSFRPVPGTPFENLPPSAPTREHRLYQASFLLRDYGFILEDLPFDDSGALPLGLDPKTAWAQAHLVEKPVEINCAGYNELLRIPGIGPKGAKAILYARRKGHLHFLEDLHKIGVNPARALPFILLDGQRPSHQLSFW